MMKGYSYELNELISDCALGTSKVVVLRGAMITARSDFNLHTQAGVIGFIENNGLEWNPLALLIRNYGKIIPSP